MEVVASALMEHFLEGKALVLQLKKKREDSYLSYYVNVLNPLGKCFIMAPTEYEETWLMSCWRFDIKEV